ncbi:MAG: hypothetical protein H6502_02760 [Candidatus Woesearchaeota archaeon]|nr:MAG: hypothetical protein H6502_02760 [Candidatus Woesearchaeota archaeon]
MVFDDQDFDDKEMRPLAELKRTGQSKKLKQAILNQRDISADDLDDYFLTEDDEYEDN